MTSDLILWILQLDSDQEYHTLHTQFIPSREKGIVQNYIAGKNVHFPTLTKQGRAAAKSQNKK